MSKSNEYDTYIIPPNFIEGGTFFGGLLKLRNTAEALVIVLAIGIPVFSVSALTLTAMDNTNIQRHSDNYEMLSTEAALRGEVIACRLRHLIYETTTIRKAEYLTSAGVMQGISVIEKDGILEITLPCLLPKKSKKHSCEYLTDPIYYTLSKYAQTHTLPKFRHCVVCFSHIYSRELSPNRVRDYDNLELKQLLDVIATFVMEDDTGLLCDAYNTTEIGDGDCTRVSVMDKERFQGWLSDRENRLRSISDL